MISFLADEDFNGRILRGLRLRIPELDLVRIHDLGLSGAEDAVVLEWSDRERRVLLTHDARTMPRHVGERLADGGHLPGVLIVDDLASIGVCIEDILLIATCSDLPEWKDCVVFLPFDRA